MAAAPLLRDAGGPEVSDEAIGSQDMAPIAAAAAAALAKVKPGTARKSTLPGMSLSNMWCNRFM